MSLWARMLLLFFGLGVLPLLVLGVVSYRQSMDAVEELLATETTSIAERTATEVESRYARYQLAGNSEPRMLMTFRGYLESITWARDGRQLAYTACRMPEGQEAPGRPEFVVMGLDGAGNLLGEPTVLLLRRGTGGLRIGFLMGMGFS